MTIATRLSTWRRFNLIDLGIIIGAVAIFFALARLSYHYPVPGGWVVYPPSGRVGRVIDLTPTWFEIHGLGWIAATLALIILRLRAPRPRWRRLMRQPGWLGCCAAGIAGVTCLAAERIQNLVDVLSMPSSDGGDALATTAARFTIFPSSTAWAGSLAVLIAWIILAADGRWLAERSWIDRTGRLLGSGWLVMPLGNLYLHVMATFVDLY